MAVKCQALSRALPSRAMRRVISVAAEPVARRQAEMNGERHVADLNLHAGPHDGGFSPRW
jgi:hypothetical protein